MSQQEPEITNQEVALKVLIQGVNLAQSRGAYNLSEAGLLDKCIKMFTRPAEEMQRQDVVINDDESEKKDDLEVENIQI